MLYGRPDLGILADLDFRSRNEKEAKLFELAMIAEHLRLFLILIAVIAVTGILAGCVLAISGYSSAGAFSVASACVGVFAGLAIGTNNQIERS